MSNAKKGPDKDYNAYRDFCDVELDAQIIMCTLAHFKMTSCDGK